MNTRKPLRLPAPAYTGRGLYFITVCTRYRSPFFNQPSLAKSLVQILKAAASHRRFLLHAWCVMPDHLHILCEGANEASAVCMFVNRCKVASAGRFQRELGRDIWQRSFYDHVLRPRESLDPFAWYIWMNPVRKGLCQDPHDYPWSGSATIDWKQAQKPEENWAPPWKQSSNSEVVPPIRT